VRCSWCEPRLAAYVDGSLSPRKRAAVAAHLRVCDACHDLYQQLRSVDALLETGRAGELPASFTSDVMGRLQAFPAPVRRGPPLLRVAALYLSCAWIAGALLLWGLRDAAPAASLAPFVAAVAAVERSARTLWPIAPLAASFGVVLLAVDALLLAGVLIFYRAVRPRVVATLTEAKRR